MVLLKSKIQNKKRTKQNFLFHTELKKEKENGI